MFLKDCIITDWTLSWAIRCVSNRAWRTGGIGITSGSLLRSSGSPLGHCLDQRDHLWVIVKINGTLVKIIKVVNRGSLSSSSPLARIVRVGNRLVLKFIVGSLEERQHRGAGEQEDQRSIGPGGPLRAGQGNNVLEVNQEERQHLDAGGAGTRGSEVQETWRVPSGRSWLRWRLQPTTKGSTQGDTWKKARQTDWCTTPPPSPPPPALPPPYLIKKF